MTADFDPVSLISDDELDLDSKAIERREVPRGPLRGLTATLPLIGVTPVLEAGTKGLFVALGEEDFERFHPGDTMAITVTRDELSFECRAEVVRKEQAPRRGIALRIIHMTPSAEATFEAMRA